MGKPIDLDELFAAEPPTPMGGKPPENAASARAAHEARTGMRANMQQLGYRCVEYGADCAPKRFLRTKRAHPEEFKTRTHSVTGAEVLLVRVHRAWVVRLRTKTGRYPQEHNLDCPSFSGPVACATWLAVELGGGAVEVT